MSTHKYFDWICVAVLVFTLALTILFMNGSRLGIETVVDEDAENAPESRFFTANDLNGSWDSTLATVISLKGDTAVVSGTGAYVNGGDVVIAADGKYVLTGALTDGSIVVDAEKASKVWLLLDGVDVQCADNACLRVEQADKVFLTLAEGSENRMSSGAVYSEQAQADGTGGTVFARDDLTINGSGSLSITAAWKHGIDANDDLVITGGSITIQAAGDAIHVNNSVRIQEAAVTVQAEDDGVVVEEPDGYVYVESGTLRIGCADDGINCGGDIVILGGDFQICAGSDGIHSDTSVSVAGGSIAIDECCEGIEAVSITVAGGEITIYAEDDGLNANGGEGFGGGQTADNQKTGDTTPSIEISGGTLTVINETARDADGLDSNGDIRISGGTVLISLVNSGSNSALDYGNESGGVCEITGGRVIACGSYAMAEGFDESSSQCSILYNLRQGTSTGESVSLEDSEGRVLLQWEVPCSFSSVVLSAPEMQLGERYLVNIGGDSEEITLSERSASFGDAASGMFGGSMNWGGMRPRKPSGGEAPDSGGGTPPERPDFSGGNPPMGGLPDMGERPQFDFNIGEKPPAASDGQSEDTAVSESISAETWVLLGISGLLLAAGILLVSRMRSGA